MTKILLIEDNEMNRDMLARRLERRGYQVVLAPDGKEGLTAARSEKPDLILMDLSLPEMDGWETTRRLRSDGALRHIPVIAITAHAMPGEREKALEAGCNDYATKPVDFPALVAQIDAALPRRGGADAAGNDPSRHHGAKAHEKEAKDS